MCIEEQDFSFYFRPIPVLYGKSHGLILNLDKLLQPVHLIAQLSFGKKEVRFRNYIKKFDYLANVLKTQSFNYVFLLFKQLVIKG